LNSGVGSNEGELRVLFEGAVGPFRACFGAGELTGLVTGERKLSMTGRILVYH
jgi:hypothetical protein